MDPDLIFIIGVVLGVFSVPSIMSAIADGRAPRMAALIIILSGAMILWAVTEKPGGYSFTEIPHLFVTVVGRYLI